MKWKAGLFGDSSYFTEVVYALNPDDAKNTTLARNAQASPHSNAESSKAKVKASLDMIKNKSIKNAVLFSLWV